MNKRNILSFLIFCAYVVSWILPIGHEDYIGYEGAELAHEMVIEGYERIKSVLNGTLDLTLYLLLNILGVIYVGLVNELFIISFLLFLLKNKWSFAFSGPAFVSMIYWGVAHKVYYGPGYSLWLFSCAMLCYLGIRLIYPDKISAKTFIKSPQMIISYISALLIAVNVLLDHAGYV